MEKSGPKWDGVGDKYTRAQLIDHFLQLSKSIQPGYEQALFVTSEGHTLSGRIERLTNLKVRFIDATGKQVNLDMRDVEELSYGPFEEKCPTAT